MPPRLAPPSFGRVRVDHPTLRFQYLPLLRHIGRPIFAALLPCRLAWGPDADRRAKLLIYLSVEGSLLVAYSHMMARIGLLRALNRNVQREFDTSRKDTIGAGGSQV
jgi:hypothetical protein